MYMYVHVHTCTCFHVCIAFLLIERSKSCKSGKSYTIAMTVAKEFDNWTKTNADGIRDLLVKEIKIAAFQV